MVSMNDFLAATSLTSILVTSKNFFAPLSKEIPFACPFPIKRFAILVGRGIFTELVGMSTSTGAIFTGMVFCVAKALSTIEAGRIVKATDIPAFLRAIFGSGSAKLLFVSATTNRASERNSLTAFVARFSFNRWHKFIIQYCSIISKPIRAAKP